MLNVAILMGRLVSDPETRYTASNMAVSRFTLAIDRAYQKPGEERQTDFIPVVAFGKSAEFASKYFRKGQLVAVEGSIRQDNYTDKDGNKRYSYQVTANQLHFAESKRSSEGGNFAPSGNFPIPGAQAPAAQAQASAAPAPSAAFAFGNADDFETMPDDDDLPF